MTCHFCHLLDFSLYWIFDDGHHLTHQMSFVTSFFGCWVTACTTPGLLFPRGVIEFVRSSVGTKHLMLLATFQLLSRFLIVMTPHLQFAHSLTILSTLIP